MKQLIHYKIKNSTQKELLLHLEKSDASFVPPLSSKVILEDYAEKIIAKAVTFEAWSETALVGVIATYFNDLESKKGFITNVSVLPQYHNLGIAGRLLEMAKKHAVQNHFGCLALEVHQDNTKAFGFYSANGFTTIAKKEDYWLMECSLNNTNYE